MGWLEDSCPGLPLPFPKRIVWFSTRLASGRFGTPCSPCVTNHNGTNQLLVVLTCILAWVSLNLRATCISRVLKCVLAGYLSIQRFVRVQSKHSLLTPVDPSTPSPAACLLLLQPGCLPASLSARLPACFSFSPAACLPLSACCKTFGACAASFAFFTLLLAHPSARRLNHDFNRRRADS